jgi:branched-chain amino acid transport system permease protein
MSDFIAGYQPFFNVMLLNCGLALSQYLVLRAGVFSVATAGLAAIGAYTAGLSALRLGLPSGAGLLAALGAGALAAAILSVPLARLRGVFQAIATLAFVQIVLSVALWATPLTGGATGLNGIPKTVGTGHLVVMLAAVIYVLAALGRSGLGRAFDAIRQDETVAVSLGVSVARAHALAFALSGGIAGLTGGLIAYHNYSVVPEDFGFAMLVSVLAGVVLGGRQAVAGPVVGAMILTALPELARPLADNRLIVHGALLMLAIIYLPQGIVDSLRSSWRRSRQRAA